MPFKNFTIHTNFFNKKPYSSVSVSKYFVFLSAALASLSEFVKAFQFV